MEEPTKQTKAVNKMVPMDMIVTEPTLQIRCDINYDTVDEYREIIKEYGVMDPVLLFDTGREDKKLTVSKGHHRILAYKREEVANIPAEIRKGSLADAKWAAFEDGHGCLPLTNADKRKAATIAVEDPTIGLKADKEIARRIGVSQSLVSEARRGITPEDKQEKRERKSKATTQAPPADPTSNIGHAEPEAVNLTTAAPINPDPPASTGGGGGQALGAVNVRERKSTLGPFENITKPMALKQVEHWVNIGLLDESDVLKKFRGGSGDFVYLPKPGMEMPLRLTDSKGSKRVELNAVIREISFSKIVLQVDQEVKVK